MKYPHYSFDGCFWNVDFCPRHRIVVFDGFDAFSIQVDDFRCSPTMVTIPRDKEKPVTKKEFEAAYKRVLERFKLQLAGKDDKHLYPKD